MVVFYCYGVPLIALYCRLLPVCNNNNERGGRDTNRCRTKTEWMQHQHPMTLDGHRLRLDNNKLSSIVFIRRPVSAKNKKKNKRSIHVICCSYYNIVF